MPSDASGRGRRGSGRWTRSSTAPLGDAFFAARDRVRWFGRALGRTSAELMAPYPPGVPVLAPGERVTAAGPQDAPSCQGQGCSTSAYAHDPHSGHPRRPRHVTDSATVSRDLLPAQSKRTGIRLGPGAQ